MSIGSASAVHPGRKHEFPIGFPFPVMDDVAGAEIPEDKYGRAFIKLTAGLTGAGQYNEGKLTSESVSGSSPSITATAVVNYTGSPMDGQTIRLLNTEERFLRAGNAGTVQNSLFGSHNHGGGNHSHTYQGGGNTGVGANAQSTYENLRTNSINNSGTIINTEGGNETRPRNVGATYYMRIK